MENPDTLDIVEVKDNLYTHKQIEFRDGRLFMRAKVRKVHVS